MVVGRVVRRCARSSVAAHVVLDLCVAQNKLRYVQNHAKDILPILRTDTQRELLIELFFETDRPRTLSDLARAINVDQTTVMREVNRLLASGVVKEERVGRARTVAINEKSPFAAPLRQLIRVVYAPLDDDSSESFLSERPHTRRHADRRPLPSSRWRS